MKREGGKREEQIKEQQALVRWKENWECTESRELGERHLCRTCGWRGLLGAAEIREECPSKAQFDPSGGGHWQPLRQLFQWTCHRPVVLSENVAW